MTFGEALRAVMNERGIRQKDIVRATGFTDAYVSMLVNGKVEDPKFSTAEKVIRALGISLDEFARVKADDTTSLH